MLGLAQRVDDYCHTAIQKRIDDGGLVLPSPNTDKILFYAGPSQEVLDAIKVKEESFDESNYPLNWTIVGEEATRLKAQRIDDTPIFTYLMSDDLRDDLAKACNISSRNIQVAVKQVWDYVSGHFSRTKFKVAATHACGAGVDSSFYLEEMYGILDNDAPEIINEKPIRLFRSFHALGQVEVFRLMRMTGLMEMRMHAKTSGDNMAWTNYKRQRKYFIVARKEEKAKFNEQPKDVREAFKEARKDILARYQSDKPKGKAPDVLSPPINDVPTVARLIQQPPRATRSRTARSLFRARHSR